jgi:hypothetical protein
VIYIPKKEKAKGWGEASGYRDKLKKRNAMICSRYSSGQSILEIAEEFFLSPETIKKLVYGKKVEVPMFSPSINSAEQYSAAGMGEEWVRTYLSSLNVAMPDISDNFLSELVRIPLRLIESSESGEDDGNICNNPNVPLIVFFEKKNFYTPYQQSYLNQLKKDKCNAHHAFIIAPNEEYSYFWNNFGKNFQR